jgi:hypothetical protein
VMILRTSYLTIQLSIFFQRFRHVLAGSEALDLVACPTFWGWSLDWA